MSSPHPAALSWSDLLDAMEERTRRLEASIRSDDGDGEPVPDVLPQAIGPLPIELAGRAQALLATTRRLEAEARRRKTELERKMRYAQA